MRIRTLFFLSSLVIFFALSREAVSQEGPHYRVKHMVGPSHPMDEELELRTQGALNVNNYVVKDRSRKVIRTFDDLIKARDGSYSFYITVLRQEKIRLDVKIERKGSGMFLQLKEASAKTKKKKKSARLSIPRESPTAKKAHRLVTRLYQFAAQADKNLDVEVKNLTPGAPPNHREMALLALFIALKTSKTVDSEVAYYNLVNYVLKRIDTVY